MGLLAALRSIKESSAESLPGLHTEAMASRNAMHTSSLLLMLNQTLKGDMLEHEQKYSTIYMTSQLGGCAYGPCSLEPACCYKVRLSP